LPGNSPIARSAIGALRIVSGGGRIGRWNGKRRSDRRYQAILPLRGKILNVEKARYDKMLAMKKSAA